MSKSNDQRGAKGRTSDDTPIPEPQDANDTNPSKGQGKSSHYNRNPQAILESLPDLTPPKLDHNLVRLCTQSHDEFKKKKEDFLFQLHFFLQYPNGILGDGSFLSEAAKYFLGSKEVLKAVLDSHQIQGGHLLDSLISKISLLGMNARSIILPSSEAERLINDLRNLAERIENMLGDVEDKIRQAAIPVTHGAFEKAGGQGEAPGADMPAKKKSPNEKEPILNLLPLVIEGKIYHIPLELGPPFDPGAPELHPLRTKVLDQLIESGGKISLSIEERLALLIESLDAWWPLQHAPCFGNSSRLAEVCLYAGIDHSFRKSSNHPLRNELSVHPALSRDLADKLLRHIRSLITALQKWENGITKRGYHDWRDLEALAKQDAGEESYMKERNTEYFNLRMEARDAVYFIKNLIGLIQVHTASTTVPDVKGAGSSESEGQAAGGQGKPDVSISSEFLIYLDMKESKLLANDEGTHLIDQIMAHLQTELKSYSISKSNCVKGDGDCLKIACSQSIAEKFLRFLRNGFEVSGSHFEIRNFNIFLDIGAYKPDRYDPKLLGIGDPLLKKYQYIVTLDALREFGNNLMSQLFLDWEQSDSWTEEEVSWGPEGSTKKRSRVYKKSDPLTGHPREEAEMDRAKKSLKSGAIRKAQPPDASEFFRVSETWNNYLKKYLTYRISSVFDKMMVYTGNPGPFTTAQEYQKIETEEYQSGLYLTSSGRMSRSMEEFGKLSKTLLQWGNSYQISEASAIEKLWVKIQARALTIKNDPQSGADAGRDNDLQETARRAQDAVAQIESCITGVSRTPSHTQVKREIKQTIEHTPGAASEIAWWKRLLKTNVDDWWIVKKLKDKFGDFIVEVIFKAIIGLGIVLIIIFLYWMGYLESVIELLERLKDWGFDLKF